MKALLAVLLGATPLVLHFAIVWDSWPLLLGFVGLAALGLAIGSRARAARPWILALGAAGVLGFVWLDHRTAAQIAFAWPILVYLAIAWVFGRTLRAGRMPLIERIARLVDHGDSMPRELIRYTRVLTWIWTVLPLGMALVSALLAQFASPAAWSLFTNVLSYAALA